MDSDFIDDDSFEAKRIELEKKKQKKLEKQIRLRQKAEIIQEIQKNLEKQNSLNHCFKNSLENANEYTRGSLKWALVFLNSHENTKYEEVRRIYLERAQLWHPDKNNDTCQEAMKYLNEAWQIIKRK